MKDYDIHGAAARLYEDPPISTLEEDMLGALEEHDQAYSAASATRNALAPLFEKTLSAWIHDGAILDTLARTIDTPRCLLGVKVASGNARGATTFRIVGSISIDVAEDGDPCHSTWQTNAIPLSPRTGKPMSGRASSSRVTYGDGSLRLAGHVFQWINDPTPQDERDAFTSMVGKAAQILHERESAMEAP